MYPNPTDDLLVLHVKRMIGTLPISTGLTATALFFAAPHAAALDRLIPCPTELQPQSIKITAAAGWVPRIDAPLKLYAAGMSAGPPGSQQTRPGRELRRTNDQVTTVYGFDPDTRPNHVWLNCTYGQGGELSISRRLDERTKECTITMFKPVPGEPRKIEMKCN